MNDIVNKYTIYAEPKEESYVSIRGVFSKTEILDILAEMIEKEEETKNKE